MEALSLTDKFRLWMVLGLICIVFGGAVGCVGEGDGRDVRGAYVVNLEGNTWSEMVMLEIANRDTLSRRDVKIFVKHQPYERLDSLAVSIYVVAPDEAILSERLTLPIEGCERGLSVMAHLHEVEYRSDVVMGQRGTYKIYIHPTTPIQGIEAVGLIVE